MSEVIKMQNKFGDEMLGRAWTCKKPIGNVIIVVGMAEKAERYEEFANFLVKNNYNVYSLDHYGHGLNVEDDSKLGIVPKSFFSKEVKILDQLVVELRSSLLPTYIFGHSMGSFFVQDYIQRFTSHVNKVILCGTDGPNSKATYKFARFLTRIIETKKNRNTKCDLMNKMAFGGYNKAIKNPRTKFDWLSINEENVDKYIADPQCGFVCSYGFYYEFMKGLNRLYKREFLKKIRKDMNVLIIGGSIDPVGKNGKGPRSLKKLYDKLGLQNVQLKLYEGLRHEIHNEESREEVYNDILTFLKEECPRAEELLRF